MILLLPWIVRGQIRSTEVIEFDDPRFSRFVLSVKPFASFEDHPRSKGWLKVIEKNLCWSGVFKLHESQNKYCHVSGNHLDLQLQMEIKKAGEVPTLLLTMADTEGNAYFNQQVPLTQNRLKESEVMTAVNQITEKITTRPGILGSTIAFTFKQPGYEKVIARINTHGQDLQAISHNQFISISPKWNAVGSRIVYTVVSSKGTSVIYDDLQGKTTPLIRHKGGNTGGTWSRDGDFIIVSFTRKGNTDLYQIDLKTRKLKRLTSHHKIDGSPSLSPDGKDLLFVSDRGGSVQIYKMYLPTREIVRLTYTGSRNTDPIWSPDGSLVAFTKQIGGRDQIYVMDMFGENVRAITRGPYASEQPAWSPDGRQIIFSQKRGRDFKLHLVFLDGEGLRRLTNGESSPAGFEEKSPSWSLRRF
ncbi:MAG: PD40 domain-containing protein [SAR324 cluster bacterium]|nr:PD40 domain-containing protein [SAR324 cluster bacterium]